MKILITNITSLRNKGCEALVSCAVRGLQSIYPEAEFVLFTLTPDYDQLILQRSFGNRITCMETPSFVLLTQGSRVTKPVKRWYPHIRKLPGVPKLPKWEAGMQAILNADLVVASGGDIFGSEYGDLTDHLKPLELAQEAGIPVVMLAHSVGPFKHEWERERFRSVAAKARLITLREARSFEYVRHLLGQHSNLHLTADVAFALNPAPLEVTAALRKLYRIPEQNVIGMALSQGIAQFSGTSSTTHYQVIRAAAERLTQSGYHLLLVPHVHERYTGNDDRLLVSRLSRDLNYTEAISPVTGDHTCEELKSLLGLSSVLVAERTHAAIGGMSQGVPTLNIAYSVKAYGITEMLFGEEAGQFRLDARNLSVEGLVSQILLLHRDRKRIRLHTEAAVLTARNQALQNYALLDKLGLGNPQALITRRL